MSGFRTTALDDVPAIPIDAIAWRPVRHELGISAFGAGSWSADAGGEVIEEHHENEDGADGHEELYLVVRGRAAFTIAGERVDAPAGTLVAVTDPAVVRSAVAEEDGTTVLAVGAPAGRAYAVAAWERRHLP